MLDLYYSVMLTFDMGLIFWLSMIDGVYVLSILKYVFCYIYYIDAAMIGQFSLSVNLYVSITQGYCVVTSI